MGMGFLLFFRLHYCYFFQVIHRFLIRFLTFLMLFPPFHAFFTEITVFCSSFTTIFYVSLQSFPVFPFGEHCEQTKDKMSIGVSIY